jgi:hypothetical protein
MRKLVLAVLLVLPGCEDSSTEGNRIIGSSDGLTSGGSSGGGGTSGGGTSGGGTSGGGGTLPTSDGAPPDVWDSDMPLSTTYHAPTVASGQAYWRLVEGYFYPSDVSASVGGDHHIYFQAKDFNGTLLEGQQGMATLYDNQLFAVTKGAIDGYRGDIPMYGTGWFSADINDSPGPYSFQMTQGGLPSYRVDGMGMHNNYHTTWWLVFQKSIAP